MPVIFKVRSLRVNLLGSAIASLTYSYILVSFDLFFKASIHCVIKYHHSLYIT